MRIHALKIENFRSIKSLEWTSIRRLVCLIGPGNAGKTTILDAIELALLPRWFANVVDDDFHGGNTSVPITIEVTVGELPPQLVTEEHLGLYLRGWSETSGVEDEPRDDLEPVVTIRFTADASLEPKWTVISDRRPDGVAISQKDREKLGVARIGDDADRQLTWMRGSALAKLGTGSADTFEALASATRAARTAVRNAELPKAITSAASAAYEAAVAFGAAPASAFVAQLGGTASVSQGALELFDGAAPARMAGLGSRRLAALGIQTSAIRDGAIVLIDEVESGLEPHRIAQLLKTLRTVVSSAGMVIVTSHSPVVLRILSATDLAVVRSGAESHTVRFVDSTLQDVVRSVPEALLSRRVVVCEGKTEHGLILGLSTAWEAVHEFPLAHVGVTIVTGPGSGGSAAPKHALKLRSLGYEVALFADGDVETPVDDELRDAGVRVIRWEGQANTELRTASDLPISHLQELITIGVEHRGEESVRSAVGNRLQCTVQSTAVGDWVAASGDLTTIRSAIAHVANKQEWFKDIDRGRRLGAVVTDAWSTIQNTALARALNALEQWIYA